jgi:glycosyltransferase involved in cell wall biosynthesis
MTPIRVAAIMEAHTLTGPAKNLIQFAVRARIPDGVHAPAEISILTFVRNSDASAKPTNAFVEAARQKDIPVIIVPERHRFDREVAKRLAAAIEQTGADIVQTHGIKGHFFLRRRNVRNGLPWLAFHHGYTTENAKVRLYNQLNRWSLPAADRVITVCQPFAKELIRSGVQATRLHVLPNSIDVTPRASTTDMETIAKQLGIAPNDRVLLAVGRFSSEKGHPDLLRAFGILRKHMPDLPLKLVLVGDGVDRQKLEHLVDFLGLRDHVVFAGHHGDVQPFYARAEVFVLPSHSEGSPNVLLEAMEAGVPIVATAVGGVPDTVENLRSALLVAPRNPHALADALGRLVAEPEFASTLSQAAAAAIAERFRPDHYRKTLLGIYADLQGDRLRPSKAAT